MNTPNIRINGTQILAWGFCDFTNELEDGDTQVSASSEDWKTLEDNETQYLTYANDAVGISTKIDDIKASEDKITAIKDTDIGYSRVLDDLINTLITKGAIKLEDLPTQAQDKHTQRESIRNG